MRGRAMVGGCGAGDAVWLDEEERKRRGESFMSIGVLKSFKG